MGPSRSSADGIADITAGGGSCAGPAILEGSGSSSTPIGAADASVGGTGGRLVNVGHLRLGASIGQRWALRLREWELLSWGLRAKGTARERWLSPLASPPTAPPTTTTAYHGHGIRPSETCTTCVPCRTASRVSCATPRDACVAVSTWFGWCIERDKKIHHKINRSANVDGVHARRQRVHVGRLLGRRRRRRSVISRNSWGSVRGRSGCGQRHGAVSNLTHWLVWCWPAQQLQAIGTECERQTRSIQLQWQLDSLTRAANINSMQGERGCTRHVGRHLSRIVLPEAVSCENRQGPASGLRAKWHRPWAPAAAPV